MDGAEPASSLSAERPDIVVTTNILGDIVGEVVGDVADVEVLLDVGADPHSYAMSAAEAERMQDADLVVANGLNLEEGMLDNVESAAEHGARVLEVAPLVDPLPYGSGTDENAGSLDPHVWTDPARMVTAVGLIEEAVAELPGVDVDRLETTATAYRQRLQTMDASMQQRLDRIPQARRQLVTNHHVFGYFAARFDFEVVGTVLPGGTTLASPSASDLVELVDVLRQTGVPAIFADSSQPARLAEALAAEADLDIEVISLHTESLGPPGSGAETYLDMLDTNTDRIVDALSAAST
jgi:zinc/manganese transport system substrate-binding protein